MYQRLRLNLDKRSKILVTFDHFCSEAAWSQTKIGLSLQPNHHIQVKLVPGTVSILNNKTEEIKPRNTFETYKLIETRKCIVKSYFEQLQQLS